MPFVSGLSFFALQILILLVTSDHGACRHEQLRGEDSMAGAVGASRAGSVTGSVSMGSSKARAQGKVDRVARFQELQKGWQKDK